MLKSLPKIFCEILRDGFHVLQKVEAARVLLGIIRGIVLNSLIDELEFFLLSC